MMKIQQLGLFDEPWEVYRERVLAAIRALPDGSMPVLIAEQAGLRLYQVHPMLHELVAAGVCAWYPNGAVRLKERWQ